MVINMRIGFGLDAHRLAADRQLYLGGVLVPHDKGLLGHSDADCLLHAVIDALLGAAALGDIGTHFPPSDDTWKDVSSMLLLEKTMAILSGEGYRISNIDATIAAQRPRLAPYTERMRENIAGVCGIALNRVSVKATTTEGMGYEGREEGITAYAVCILE